jgi:prephenate dehydrogenase
MILMSFHKVGFIGFGLIGGSIAQKMKQNDPAVQIYAFARHAETIEEAHRMGLICNDTLLPLTAFGDCDYIFLCAPVEKNIEYLRQLKDIISPDCCITDVGSTKSAIHQEVIALGLESQFIGGHPMTGSEKTGVSNASSSILENAYYIITPTTKTTPERLQEFEDFVRSLGSIPLILDYESHDHATASISHLPHMIAFSLVNLVKAKDDAKETMKTIAAGGFRDITRIASSSPVMWQNICLSNQSHLLELMDEYIRELGLLRQLIDDKDGDGLLNYFSSAKDYRDSFSVPNRDFCLHEIYLDIDDEAGAIATIAGILAGDNISIKNIGIIHNREFEEGVLRIEFYDATAKELAAKILSAKHYTLFRR